MPKGINISLGLDFVQNILGAVSPVTPALGMYFADYDQFTYAVLTTKADTLAKAIALANIYNTGESIMPNSLIVHNATYSDAIEHELVVISTTGAVGEQISSLKVSNRTGSDITVTFKITDTSDVVKIQFTEDITTGENLVPISALDRMNLLDTDKVKVTSSVAGNVDYYLSTNLGVSI